MSAEAVWIGWLVLFLVYELYAAKAKPLGDTLSENVWHWFDTTLKRLVFSAFWIALGVHFIFHTSAIPVGITALGIVLVIVLHVMKENSA